jgi:hypothetical protein
MNPELARTLRVILWCIGWVILGMLVFGLVMSVLTYIAEVIS